MITSRHFFRFFFIAVSLVSAQATFADPPVITSSLTVDGTVGVPLEYEITADNSPTSFGASGVDSIPGLTFDPTTGVISGTPTKTGTFPVQISASNASGQDIQTLSLSILDPVPTITSATSVQANVGLGFNYRITADGNPTGFEASGLVPIGGLSVDPATGVISGVPVNNGVYSVVVSATNAAGTGSTSVIIVVDDVPEITSPTTASGNSNSLFAYQITATNNPTGFGASGVQQIPGLSFSPTSGIISGIPAVSGTFTITISASNAVGSDSQNVTLTFDDSAASPVIVSDLFASGIATTPFSYRIDATNNPTSFSVSGLSAIAGLSFDSATGVISGAPTTAGSFGVTITATNAQGSDVETLIITIDAASPPVITSPTSANGIIGNPFTYQITATDQPVSFNAQGLDAIPGLRLNTTTGQITGTPTESGTFTVTLSASNAFGTGSLNLEIAIADAIPLISSGLQTVGVLNESFSYEIRGTNNPTSFSAVGLDAVGGLSINSATGIISGTPQNTGEFPVTILATNTAGSGSATLTVTVFPAAPTVTIDSINGGISPIEATLLPDGNFNTFEISATVTAGGAASIQLVNVLVDGVVFARMSAESVDPTTGNGTYRGTLPIGFSAGDLEVNGGQHTVEVRAFQSDGADRTSSVADIIVTPLVQLIQPTPGSVVSRIVAGDSFMVALVQSNILNAVTGNVIGPGDTVTVDGELTGENIFSFITPTPLAITGVYTNSLIATDTLGNTTTTTRVFNLEQVSGQPSVSIVSPNNGFVNVPFSPAIIEVFPGTGTRNLPDGVVLRGVLTDDDLDVEIPGEGYWPLTPVVFPTTVVNPETGATAQIEVAVNEGSVEEVTVINSDPRTIGDPEFNSFFRFPFSPNGAAARIDIQAQASARTSPIATVDIYVNGQLTDSIPAPGPYIVSFPTAPEFGSFAPKVGDYIAQAVVTDAEGKVGFSNSVQFTIRPKTTPRVTFSNVGDEVEVNQGGQIAFVVSVESEEQIQKVELIDGETDAVLGQMQRVAGSLSEYRRSVSFDQLGVTQLLARATTAAGDVGESLPISISTIQVGDIDIAFVNPTGDITIFANESIDFDFSVTSTSPVQEVNVFINGISEQTINASPYSFTRQFTNTGINTVRAEAVDIFGNVAETGAIQVTVEAPPPPSVTIVKPNADIQVDAGETVSLEVNASSSQGSITQVEFLLNGQVVQTFTEGPYVLDQVFSNPGTSRFNARATDTFGFTASSDTRTITVLQSNPISSNSSFVKQTYDDLLFRSPTTTELEDGLTFLNGGGSKGQFVANLMTTNRDLLGFSTILQIFRTGVGQWLDREGQQQELNEYAFSASGDLFNPINDDGLNVGRTNNIAYANNLLRNEFTARFPGITVPVTPQDLRPGRELLVDTGEFANEMAFINQLYRNKYGQDVWRFAPAVAPHPFSAVVLGNALFNTVDETSFTVETFVIDGIIFFRVVGGDIGGEMLQDFATINQVGSDGLSAQGAPFSVKMPNTSPPSDFGNTSSEAVFGFEILEQRFVEKVRTSMLVAGLLRRQPSDAEVNALVASGDLATVAQNIIDSSEYAARFDPVFRVDLAAVGPGTATITPINPDESGQADFVYIEGTPLTFTATPNGSNDNFLGWTINGSDRGTDNPLELVLSEDIAVAANFSALMAVNLLENHFIENGVTSPDPLTLEEDFDQDGFSNLAELAFGTNLTRSDSKPLFGLMREGNHLKLEFVRIKASAAPEGMAPVVQYNHSLDPNGWTLVPEANITTDGVSQAGLGADYERVLATIPGDSDFVFVRGRVNAMQ